MNRRHVLALGAAALATPALAAGADPLKGVTVINALGGLHDPNFPEPPRPVLTPRILADALASGTTAVNVTIGYVAGPGDPFEVSVREVGQWERLIRERPDALVKVTTALVCAAESVHCGPDHPLHRARRQLG